jgi:hypothetical protein
MHEVRGLAAAAPANEERGGAEANEARQSGVKNDGGNLGLRQAAPLLCGNTAGKELLMNAGRLRGTMVANGLDQRITKVVLFQ